MNEAPLPEELAKWPRDPYALLGVEVGVSARDLRKAYSRLIRRFKPEQYPDHFRRIRDAYETIERELKFKQAITPPVEPAEDADDKTFGQCIEETGGDIRVNPWYPSLSQSQEEEVEEAWNEAVHGDPTAGYLRLVDLYQRHGDKANLAQRLYWLLVVQATLDPQRTACDWLVQGLCDQKLQGGCKELYRREVDRNPAEALSARFTRLLQQPADAMVLAEFVHWRWLAAGRLRNGQAIAADLDPLRARFAADHEEIWVRLLLVAVDQLAWLDDQASREALRSCQKEIDAASHLHARLGEALTRLDMLLEISSSVRRAAHEQTISHELAEMFPALWNQPVARSRTELLAWLGKMRLDPHRWLREFDALQMRAPTVLAQLGRSIDLLLDCLPAPYAEGRRPDVLAELVLEFMEGIAWHDYADVRPHLLDFCFSQLVAPESILQLLEQVPKYVNSGFTQLLQEDWPLRYACLGYRMFWASA